MLIINDVDAQPTYIIISTTDYDIRPGDPGRYKTVLFRALIPDEVIRCHVVSDAAILRGSPRPPPLDSIGTENYRDAILTEIRRVNINARYHAFLIKIARRRPGAIDTYATHLVTLENPYTRDNALLCDYNGFLFLTGDNHDNLDRPTSRIPIRVPETMGPSSLPRSSFIPSF